MALQGDLSSFALPDVLRLLAGTGKSGCLEVTASEGTGEVWLYEGQIIGGAVSSAGHAVAPADVVFELLRQDGGSFVFDDEEVIDEAPGTDVETVLADAEGLVAEWVEVEAVVPSMDAWVTLAADIDDEVTVSVERWRAIAAVGSGGTVRDLADSLSQTDLAASRTVKDLVEHQLAAVRADHVGQVARQPQPVVEEAPAAAFVAEDLPYDPDARYAPHEAEDELAVLRTEERPVVMEERDDALLPEPLPGEGTSYADEVLDVGIGSVDGRHPDDVGPEPTHLISGFEPAPYAASSFEPAPYDASGFEPSPLGATDFEPTPAPATAQYTGYGDTFPDEAAPRAEFLEDFAASMAATPEPEPAAAPEAPADDDRGSLLKFLSTVKP